MTSATRSRIWKASKILAVAIFVVYLSAWLFGKGGRAQFSPDTLEFRSQRELLVPLAMLPVYRSRWNVYELEFVQYLVRRGYWSPRNVAEPIWTGVFHWNSQWRDGESGIYDIVYRRSGDLTKWTEENTDLAAVVWPRFLELLREQDGEQSCAMELLWQAQRSSSRLEFEQRMARNIDWPAGLAYLPRQDLPEIRIDSDTVDTQRDTKE